MISFVTYTCPIKLLSLAGGRRGPAGLRSVTDTDDKIEEKERTESEENKQEYSKSETQSEAEGSLGRSSLTGFISPPLRQALKRDTPKYPNYTCTSCPFVNGNSAFFSPSPKNTKWTIVRRGRLRRPAQTSMSVLLEAGGSDVLLMALIGHCISAQ